MNSPFIGPSPLGDSYLIFGRDKELYDLQCQLFGDRIIVLYSPSGAGKTSLLMAKNGLLARIRTRFNVLPVLRINGAASQSPVAVILSQLNAGTDDLVGHFHSMCPAEKDKPFLLVIDQFEEIFNERYTHAQRDTFFEQLGELLEEEKSPVWLILSMREEYFSSLDMWREFIPTGLNNTFRLPLLSKTQALDAIKKPIQALDITFPSQDSPDAAEYIVDELCQYRAHTKVKAEGRTNSAIEPVLLQVVCSRLWEKLSTNGTCLIKQITLDDVKELKMDDILLSYCNEALQRATPNLAGGRSLREWIDSKMFTESGYRLLAIAKSDDNDHPTDEQIDTLLSTHLIRQINRDDGVWYELAHERLVEPVRQSIHQWREANLEPWQLQARKWRLSQNHKEFFSRLPVSLRHFPGPRKFNAINPFTDKGYTDTERLFVEAYKGYTRSWWKIFLVGVFAVVGLCFSIAWGQYERITRLQEEITRGDNDIYQTGLLNILNGKTSLENRAIAAVGGVELQLKNPQVVRSGYIGYLSNLLFDARQIDSVIPEKTNKFTINTTTPTTIVTTSPTYTVLAQIGRGRWSAKVRDNANQRVLWGWDKHPGVDVQLTDMRSVLIFKDAFLAIGDSGGRIGVWELRTRKSVPLQFDINRQGLSNALTLSNHEKCDSQCMELQLDKAQAGLSGPIKSMLYSDGKLYVGYDTGYLVAWDLGELKVGMQVKPLMITVVSKGNRVSALAKNPDVPWVAAVDISGDESVKLIGGGKLTRLPVDKSAQETSKGWGAESFYSVAVSPDNRYIAAGTFNGKIHVWQMPSKGKPVWRFTQRAHTQAVSQLSWLRDGTLISAGWDGQLIAWMPQIIGNGEVRSLQGRTLLELPHQIISFAPDSQQKMAVVTTEKGDVLNLYLTRENNLIGEMVPEKPVAVSVSSLVKQQVSVFEADSQWLFRPKIASPNGQVPESSTLLVTFLRNALFPRSVVVGPQKNVFYTTRQGAVSDRPLPDFLLPSDTIQSISHSYDGSLLLVQTTVSPSTFRLASLSPDYQMLTECTLPEEFNGSSSLAVFRPQSKDLLLINRVIPQAILWHAVSFTPSGCPVYVKEIKFVGGDKNNNGRQIPFPDMHMPRGYIGAVSFSPDGQNIYLSNAMGMLYKLALGGVDDATVINDYAKAVGSVIAVSGNNTVAMGDVNGHIWLFFKNNSLPVELRQQYHHSAITEIAISQDGHWLATQSAEGMALWDLRISTWIERACALAPGLGFTQKDVAYFFPDMHQQPTSCPTNRKSMATSSEEYAYAIPSHQ
ncbi:hypothetical protein [Buttiauxella sp. A111]|uniref:nSTAND1 domain-containing NTPase n=1 Tax=Buttiauxella sp. A111 TaxID=2563088 RepID=UPI0010DA6269|nr:hypothetical protein [Buttiauxella sp. A111]GDX04618.1 hypothetical protein BSPA111_07860 [Buttiauxella sp. A111]